MNGQKPKPDWLTVLVSAIFCIFAVVSFGTIVYLSIRQLPLPSIISHIVAGSLSAVTGYLFGVRTGRK